MKSSWPTKKLVEVCDLQRGNEPGSRTYNEEGKGIRFIRVADISKQRTSPIWTTGKNLVICNKNDILMTFDGSPGVVFRGIEGAISSGIRIIKPKNSKELFDDFLFYVLQTEPVQNTVKKYTIGVSIWHASKSIPHIEIPLPPLEIQKRIVARIEELFAKIDKAKELREKVLEGTKQIFQSALQEIFSKAEKEYGTVKVSDVIKKPPQYGYTASATENLIGPKLLRITDIQNRKVDWDKVPYCKCSDKEFEKYKLEEDDILFARTGATTGKTYLITKCPKRAVFGSYLIRIKVNKEKIKPEYTFEFFQSPQYWRQIMPYGGAQPNMNARLLSKIKIPLPPLSEQKKIVAYLDNLREKVEKLKQLQQKQLEELTELKNSILEKAFKGELI
jgi:type I restriction enzyme S subunit